jgi:AcrR family transcriptional regulator
MVEAASAHGYLGATVTRVVELAGVSRATFYEQFSDRDECFQEAYRAKIEGVRDNVRAVVDPAPASERPKAVVEALLGELAADPLAARFLLIEALAVPAEIRAEHEQLILEVDRAVASFLDEQACLGALQAPSTSLLSGVADVLAQLALAEETEDLSRVSADLMRWIGAYRLPDGERPLPQSQWRELGRFAKLVAPKDTEPSLLPRGRSALPQQHVDADRQQRLLDATARLAAEDGYASLTVAGIAAAARVPRAAFYSHLASKRDALMSAQTHALQGAIGAAAAAYSPVAPWPQRVWKAMHAFLTYVAEMPDYARLEFVESYAAGPEAIRHRHRNQMVFALFLEDGYRQNPQAVRLPRACSEAIAGAVFGLVRRLVVEGKTNRMLSCLPAVAYTILAPFIGPQEAATQVKVRAGGAR